MIDEAVAAEAVGGEGVSFKLHATTIDLREALVACAKVSSKNSKPALERVVLRVLGDGAVVEGTDLETYVRATLHCVPAGDGACCFRLADVLPFVKVAEGEIVTVEETGDGLRFSTDADEALDVRAEDVDEFPVFPDVPSGGVEVPAHELRRALWRVLPAVTTAPGRYAMHGAQVQAAGGGLRIVGTDGRRLHVADAGPVKHDDAPTETLGLVPRASVQRFIEALPKKLNEEGPLSATIIVAESGTPFGTALCLRYADVVLFARLIDGEFPRYEAVLPKDPVGDAFVDTAEAIKRIALVGSALPDAEVRAVRWSDDHGRFKLVAGSVGREASAVLKSSEVVSHVGAPGSAAFALQDDYTVDVLKAADAARVQVLWTDAVSPVEFRVEKFRGVVMPITLDEAAPEKRLSREERKLEKMRDEVERLEVVVGE